MSQEKRQILEMLSEGKISAAEAERLLDAVEAGGGERKPSHAVAVKASPLAAKKRPNYLCVRIEDGHGINKDHVNIRIPFGFLRAGMKFKGMIPGNAADKVEAALKGRGIEADLGKMNADDLELMLSQLGEFVVDIDDKDGSTVRIYCE